MLIHILGFCFDVKLIEMFLILINLSVKKLITEFMDPYHSFNFVFDYSSETKYVYHNHCLQKAYSLFSKLELHSIFTIQSIKDNKRNDGNGKQDFNDMVKIIYLD